MLKSQSKQVIIYEPEAQVISDILKEKMIEMVRSGTFDNFDLNALAILQKRYEDIVKYIRRKESET